MIKLFFVGDIINKECNNKNIVSDELYEIINEHDIKCCNFEAPIVDDNTIQRAKKIGPVHCQTSEALKKILQCGFNMFSIANNHIMDYGINGLKNTINFLKNEIIIGAGKTVEEAYKTYIYEKNNIKIGFLSVAENGFGACTKEGEAGYAWMFHNRVEEEIRRLKRECNYVIMNCHAGAELYEYPLPEIRETYKKFINIGADVIIGHHPHIIQGYEEYKGGVVFYSLGNFIFSNTKKIECKKSNCISIQLDEKEFKYNIIPVIFENGQVVLDKNNESINKTEKLSKEINNDKYADEIDKFCVQMYNNTYRKYYLSCFGINKDGLLNKIKSSIKMFFNKKFNNELLLYHNLTIETHLWICRRALKIINKL